MKTLEAHNRTLAATWSTGLPARAGAGFKTQHADQILTDDYRIGFLEVHAENYMGAGGHPHRILTRMRADFPLSIHGVGLSIGSPSGLDSEHLNRLKTVVDRYQPEQVSEHLAWSTHDNHFFNDLLPVPYNEATLSRVCDHISKVQETLGRTILLENPSTYIAFEAATMSETDFIRAIVQRTGCGLLLDVSNIHVSATNHAYSRLDYLASFPLEHVREIHLAGHATDEDDLGAPLLIDSHDRAVDDIVWALYTEVLARTGPLPTLIEWDNDVPDWPILKAEAQRAEKILDRFATFANPRLRHAG
ncbi:DUF692 domain-containing protein [Peteryoungia desertarenae]|uniref:UPF0276 protein FE840_000305 n=1 Tax=Peteryoungia desertarenae TaxID=1813451 RepID=A0ABX6QJ63_9HYPH|nr:DUF692 domain-containing protein [Peteryoungia desertarenae]QLF68125.1 DUF692 domain-containing protein [Peteryoungia desertarenae]